MKPTDIDSFLTHMTLKQQVGQLICPYILCDSLIPETEQIFLQDLAQSEYGGYILFGGAIKTQAWIQTLQKQTRVPLFIASDIEAGTGQQIWGASFFPSNMALGATGKPAYAYQQGKYTAEEAKLIGINWAYAPVVDVNNNPENPIINIRSYGESPTMVAEMGAAFITGCQTHGVLATAKHFPGHGNTHRDSHTALPVIDGSREDFFQTELVPFRAAIQAGVAAIMTAHIAVPALDPDHPHLPATLSYEIMTKLLRQELGFEGIIVTDALIMEGIKGLSSPEETALQSLAAGCDMILMPEDPTALVGFLTQAVTDGRLSAQRLEESVRRVLRIKQQFGLWEAEPHTAEDLAKLGQPATVQAVSQICEDSLTLVMDQQQLLPLKPQSKLLNVVINDDALANIDRYWTEALNHFGSQVTTVELTWETPDEVFTELLAQVAQADYTVIAIYSLIKAWKDRLSLEPRALHFIRQFPKDKSCLVVNFGNPYLLAAFPHISTYACAYTLHPFSEQYMVQALFGQRKFKGQLPVSLIFEADSESPQKSSETGERNE